MFEMQKIYKPCARCGVEMYVIPQQKYCCKECRRKEEYMRKQKRKEKVRKKDNRKALADIARKAKAEGLTYGQYCAKYGLY